MLRTTSLTARLFLASALLLPLLLGFSATMLNHAYQRSLRSAERDALRGQIYLLLGAAEPAEEGIQLPPVLPEPRYSTVNSGLIGWVLDTEQEVLWRSRSGELIGDSQLPKITSQFQPGRERFFNPTIEGQEYYAISYDTLWDVDNMEQGFRFVAMHSRSPMYNEMEAYQKRLWKWLGGMAFLLIIVQTLIAKWGLSPLRKLAGDLEKVEEGTQQKLRGVYPAEIQPVTHNLNRVLSSEQTQRERYRNTLSDLAHSLKTPLAVMRGQIENPQEHTLEEITRVIDEQVSRMSAIVDHQLRRASAQVTQASGTAVPIEPIIERLVNAMHKVYRSKGVKCSYTVEGQLGFYGDEADFMELVGNLIDNACKYGEQEVLITCKRVGNQLEINVEDDGAGVIEDVRKAILTRGARADTATPGQGIGLAVAVDILSSYGGNIDILKSQLGGACFKLQIPNWQS